MSVLDVENKTKILLAESILGGYNGEKYIDWAIDLLKNEYMCESLCILAGLDSYEWYDIKKYFEQACSDFNINIDVDKHELTDFYVDYILKKAIIRKIDIDKSLSILSDMYWKTHDEKYAFFYYLCIDIDIWEDYYASTMSGEERDAYIIGKYNEYLEKNERSNTK